MQLGVEMQNQSTRSFNKAINNLLITKLVDRCEKYVRRGWRLSGHRLQEIEIRYVLRGKYMQK